ncbi:hypothetical protein [Rhodoferax sp. U11-2br]|uniref:hypothetical protein n=1 Tax=Rhodoferax sp. U11-2br TaxID=2838878 RepID=UPI001BE7BBF6|nr:hypothetical protein [Rhodoferax sp. U11-2br]MBT3067617.1 hypothetical protein [Rhodoferax sp. U11-2br]
MSIESPLFQSSMELLGHAITHFNGTSELDRKLVILHLSNSVELLLKDMILDSGESIYKNPKETITIHGCIELLGTKKIAVPFLNKLELLVDERNALQHRFGSPNELTAIFYMNVALEFFRSVLKQHYSQDLDELIAQFADEKDLIALKMREPSNDSELENLKKLGKVHPLGALLSAIAYLEKTILQFGSKVGIGDRYMSPFPVSARYLEINGIELSAGLRDRLENTRRLRNQAAHGRAEPTREDVVVAVSSIEELEKFLASLNIDETRNKVAIARKQREAERPSYESSRVLLPPDQWMHETLKTFLMSEPALGGRKFIIDVRDSLVSVSHLPHKLPGSARVHQYTFTLNEKGDNISSESDRIKSEILKDCLMSSDEPVSETKSAAKAQRAV